MGGDESWAGVRALFGSTVGLEVHEAGLLAGVLGVTCSTPGEPVDSALCLAVGEGEGRPGRRGCKCGLSPGGGECAAPARLACEALSCSPHKSGFRILCLPGEGKAEPPVSPHCLIPSRPSWLGVWLVPNF